jgi:6-phosphofructokinase 1
MKKRIALITTGGDCAGLNNTIFDIIRGADARGWEVLGIIDGTDGLLQGKVIKLSRDDFPCGLQNNPGSLLQNGVYASSHQKYWERAFADGTKNKLFKEMDRALKKLRLDALIYIGGNGSISWAYKVPEIYDDLQLIFIPKTIDMDIPLTSNTIGFDTAVQQLSNYIDVISQSARSHHRWFVVEAMGRDSGHLALRGGIAGGSDAIIIPELDSIFDMKKLIKFIKDTGRDYGTITVAEGCRVSAAEIADAINKAGMSGRACVADYFQRGGVTVAHDRLLASQFAAKALDEIEKGATCKMVCIDDAGQVSSASVQELYDNGLHHGDPNVPSIVVAYDIIHENDPYLEAALDLGIFLN